MKFNPTLPSIVFALNQKTVEADLVLIKTFCTSSDIAKLKSKWNGKEENSYQVNTKEIDTDKFLRIIKLCEQEAYLQVLLCGRVYLVNSDYRKYSGDMGTFQTVSGLGDFSTQCLETGMCWEAMT